MGKKFQKKYGEKVSENCVEKVSEKCDYVLFEHYKIPPPIKIFAYPPQK